MSSAKNFQEISYKLHEKQNFIKEGQLTDIQKSWLQEGTVDHWRHDRMYRPLTPLLKNFPESKWITIGDGRFGLDAIKLKKIESSIKVTPIDISTNLLEIAKANGLIEHYATENAEKLSFPDDAFDFAFCKESFHHFPRPYIALYEMLRVAKEAVVLIEPDEFLPLPWFGQLLFSIKRSIKKLFNRQNPHPENLSFEAIGNYIYRLSERELTKVAMGLNLPAVATYKLNDYYASGVEFEKTDPNSKLFKEIKKQIAKRDRFAGLGIWPYGIIVGIIFKQTPDEILVKKLNEVGFKIDLLPRNPYLTKE